MSGHPVTADHQWPSSMSAPAYGMQLAHGRVFPFVTLGVTIFLSVIRVAKLIKIEIKWYNKKYESKRKIKHTRTSKSLADSSECQLTAYIYSGSH